MIFGTRYFGAFHELYRVKPHRITIINFRAVNSSVSGFAHVPLCIGSHIVDFNFLNWFGNKFFDRLDLFHDCLRLFVTIVVINVLYIRIIKNLAHLLATFVELGAQVMGILAILNSIMPYMAHGTWTIPSNRHRISILVRINHFADLAFRRIVVILILAFLQ